MMKVLIDKDDENTQIYGTHRYDTKFGRLSKQSSRKYYPDILSTNRTESCIKDAIKNYNSELDAQIEKIREQYR